MGRISILREMRGLLTVALIAVVYCRRDVSHSDVSHSEVCELNELGNLINNYKSNVTITKSNYTCQMWTSDSPHRSNYKPDTHPNKGLGDHNFCRNPDDDPRGAWCYTTDKNKVYDYCTCSISKPQPTCVVENWRENCFQKCGYSEGPCRYCGENASCCSTRSERCRDYERDAVRNIGPFINGQISWHVCVKTKTPCRTLTQALKVEPDTHFKQRWGKFIISGSTQTNITQTDRFGKNYLLGKFDKLDLDTSTSSFTQGHYCWVANRQRNLSISWSCGEDFKITQITEHPNCVYHIKATIRCCPGLYKNTQNNQMGYEVVDQTACLAKCRHGGKCDACGRGGYCCTSNPGRSHENGNCEFSMLEPLKAWYDETGHDYHMCVRPYQGPGPTSAKPTTPTITVTKSPITVTKSPPKDIQSTPACDDSSSSSEEEKYPDNEDWSCYYGLWELLGYRENEEVEHILAPPCDQVHIFPTFFDTERRYDILEINGKKFSGNKFFSIVTKSPVTFKFTSDKNKNKDGIRLRWSCIDEPKESCDSVIDSGEFCSIHNALAIIKNHGGITFSANFRDHVIKGSIFGDLIEVDDEGVETKKGTFASVNNGTVLNYINDDKNCVATKTKQAASLYCSCGEEFAIQDIRPSSDGCNYDIIATMPCCKPLDGTLWHSLVPSEKSLLVLSSYNGLGKSQLPKTALFSASDLSKQDASNFVFGEQTSIFGSCSASLYGELFVLGGHQIFPETTRQVSRVTSCGIERVGTLAKAFSRGACATLKPTDELEYVLLCFSHSAGKLCTKFLGFNGNRTGVIQETGPQSNSDHLTTSLGLFDGHAIVVGSAPDRERGIGGNKKVEIMKGNNWQPLRDFPLIYRQKIWYYSMVNFKEDLYLFGGVSDNYRPLDGAYKFSKNEFRRIGSLWPTARFGHRSIVMNSEIYHIGGCKADNQCEQYMEIWSLTETDSFDVRTYDIRLKNYAKYPEVFLVENNEDCSN